MLSGRWVGSHLADRSLVAHTHAIVVGILLVRVASLTAFEIRDGLVQRLLLFFVRRRLYFILRRRLHFILRRRLIFRTLDGCWPLFLAKLGLRIHGRFKLRA